MKILRLLCVTFLLLASSHGWAQRMPVPIINHQDVAINRPSGKPLSAEEVKQAIMAAAVAGPRKWQISEPGADRMVATYHVRTHTIVTEIRYSPERFSVVYRDSVNMKYAPGQGQDAGVIHPFYNQWVRELTDAIVQQVSKT